VRSREFVSLGGGRVLSSREVTLCGYGGRRLSMRREDDVIFVVPFRALGRFECRVSIREERDISVWRYDGRSNS
jgi:hypothetical protein